MLLHLLAAHASLALLFVPAFAMAHIMDTFDLPTQMGNPIYEGF